MSSDPRKDPLTHIENIPATFEQYFLPNCERGMYSTKNYTYLEQRYINADCLMCWLDFEIYNNCEAQPVSDEPMITILHMLNRSVKGFLSGYGPAPLYHGRSYLLYLPQEAAHSVQLNKGHLRVMYCAISNSYLTSAAAENKGIADLLQLFNSGSPFSLLEKPAEISNKAAYQMWQVIHFNESKALRENHLKARCLDLVNEYVRQANLGESKVRRFGDDILHGSEYIFLAHAFIDEYQSGKMKIEDVAMRFNVSKQKLTKGFKETFDIPIGQYINKVKMKRACALLAENDKSIEQIADEMGYLDKSNLPRIFKKTFGVSPSNYRKNLRKKSSGD